MKIVRRIYILVTPGSQRVKHVTVQNLTFQVEVSEEVPNKCSSGNNILIKIDILYIHGTSSYVLILFRTPLSYIFNSIPCVQRMEEDSTNKKKITIIKFIIILKSLNCMRLSLL